MLDSFLAFKERKDGEKIQIEGWLIRVFSPLILSKIQLSIRRLHVNIR